MDRCSIVADDLLQDFIAQRCHRSWFGVDNLLWSNDYPHHRHDWPYSRRIIEETMAGVDHADKHKMICANALALYKLDE